MNRQLLRAFVYNVIYEGKVDDLKVQNPSFSSYIDELSVSVKLKYLPWALRQVKAGERTEDVILTLSLFDKNFQRLDNKDINSYTSLKQLDDVVKTLGQSKKSQYDDVKIRGAEKIFANDRYELLFIKTRDASMCYGKGTKWCISALDDNQWDYYSNRNAVFYFLVDKTADALDPLAKIAITIIRDSIDNNSIVKIMLHDATDDVIDAIPLHIGKYVNIAKHDSYKRESNSPLILVKQGKLSKDQTFDLLKNGPTNIRSSVIPNIKNKEWLVDLINDENEYVRGQVANYIEPKYLPLMMNDQYFDVRRIVARRIDLRHVSKMNNDEDQYVRVLVNKRLEANK